MHPTMIVGLTVGRTVFFHLNWHLDRPSDLAVESVTGIDLHKSQLLPITFSLSLLSPSGLNNPLSSELLKWKEVKVFLTLLSYGAFRLIKPSILLYTLFTCNVIACLQTQTIHKCE